MNRAAVVIGVDRTGGLVALTAAAKGAEEISGWLGQDGYEVVCLTDRPDPATGDPRPVTRKMILDAVSGFVSRGTLDRLVIYFAGHGYLNGTSELWLLSGAPDDPAEAVDETLSAEMARQSDIANVVFISDACRSIPGTLLGQRVNGGSIFPNRTGGAVETQVDHFFATRPGSAAIEANIADPARATGLFTKVLQDSHFDPPRDQLIEAERKRAVPSRWLRTVLPDRVDEEAQRASLSLTQRPQIRLESEPTAFVGFARFSEIETRILRSGPETVDAGRRRGLSSAPPPPPAPSTPRTASPPPASPGPMPGMREESFAPEPRRVPDSLTRFTSLLSDDAANSELVEIERQVEAALEAGGDPRPGRRGEFAAWVKVTGASVARARTAGKHAASLINPPSDRARIGIALDGGARACSVAIELRDGSGTVVAALRDYECRIAVSSAGVEDVSYAPFAGPHAQNYLQMHEEIDRTRAVASAAAAHGLLKVDREGGGRLADATRRYKMFDPALGMVAALAYAASGQPKRAASVLNYSRQDLGIDLFDLWLLAGARGSSLPRYPFCPMMTQSWSYLEARGVALHPDLKAAGRHSGFWTTFSKGEMDRIFALVAQGELK